LARARAIAENDGAATALAIAAPRDAAPGRRACQRCGGWMVEAAAACADCGAAMLRLEGQRGGSAVLMTGPGRTADALDAWRHVALYKILEELPAGWLPAAPGRRRVPRVPVYVAKDLTPASADALVARLSAAGFESRALRSSLRPGPGIPSKVWRLTWRYFAGGLVVVQTQSAWQHFSPRRWGIWSAFAGFFVMGAAAIVTSISVAVRATRTLLTRQTQRREDEALARLARALPALGGRQDRRLVARLVERLGQIAALGHGEVAAPLARRAAEAAQALLALEERRRHDVAIRADVAGALEELRREERQRVLLQTYLLRAASRFDDLALAATRAGAAAPDEKARIAAEIRDLGLAIDADEEVARLLGEAS
jgi:hypothetical protein